MLRVKTDFYPAINGHQFSNRFILFSRAKKNRLNGLIRFPIVYGLCGGMCFAALDYYYAGVQLPAYTSVDDIPSEYFRYLYKRQTDSLPVKQLWKIIHGMFLKNHTVVMKYNLAEIPKITSKLDYGDPTVLILIRGQGISDPTHNHQAIAVGYEFSSNREFIRIYLYDPNHPKLESSITQYLTPPYTIYQSTGENLRGFFIQNYRYHPPVV